MVIMITLPHNIYNQGGDGVWADEIMTWVAQSNDALKNTSSSIIICLIH